MNSKIYGPHLCKNVDGVIPCCLVGKGKIALLFLFFVACIVKIQKFPFPPDLNVVGVFSVNC